MFTDSHAHLSSDAFSDEELSELLNRAKDQKVRSIINICTDKKSLDRGLILSQKYSWIKCTGATTPHDVEKEGLELFPIFEKAALEKSLVAVGETGLDYYYEHSNREVQQEYFIKYMDLAKRCKLPLIIHCRDAFQDLFKLLDQEYEGLPFILHCFTGSLEEAKGVLDRGGFISMSGIVTFKKSESLREVAAIVPLDHLLIETDSPYLAPQSMRGKRNEPAYLPYVAECIAKVKEISIEEVAIATSSNSKNLFKLESI